MASSAVRVGGLGEEELLVLNREREKLGFEWKDRFGNRKRKLPSNLRDGAARSERSCGGAAVGRSRAEVVQR